MVNNVHFLIEILINKLIMKDKSKMSHIIEYIIKGNKNSSNIALVSYEHTLRH